MEREITYDDVLVFIIKNKDNEKMMADLNRTTYAFTAKYKQNYKGQTIDTEDGVVFKDLRDELSNELINRLDIDIDTAKKIARKWINKKEYELFKEDNKILNNQKITHLLGDFYDNCVERIQYVKQLISGDNDDMINGLTNLSGYIDIGNYGVFTAQDRGDRREDVLSGLTK